MKILRALGGALLWIVASVVCLVALILCATIVLLPLGIPLFMLGRKLFGQAVRLFLPRTAAHPVKTSRRASRSAAKSVASGVGRTFGVMPRPDSGKARKKLATSRKTLKKVAHA